MAYDFQKEIFTCIFATLLPQTFNVIILNKRCVTS